MLENLPDFTLAGAELETNLNVGGLATMVLLSKQLASKKCNIKHCRKILKNHSVLKKLFWASFYIYNLNG